MKWRQKGIKILMIFSESNWRTFIESPPSWKKPFQALLLGFLWLLSLFYSFGLHIRHFLYTMGFWPTQKMTGAKIISVGSIQVGGTGKTPFVALLLKSLHTKTSCAVLSRGYRSQAEKGNSLLFLPEAEGIPSAKVCGDEPRLLALRFPNVLFAIGRNRVESAKKAIDRGARLLVLEDGFQHRALERDLDIVLLDAHKPLGNGYLLPRGTLRDLTSRLSKANLVVFHHTKNQEQFEKACKEIAQYTKVPCIGTQMAVSRIVKANGETISSINGKKVALFCGLAQPCYFVETVKELGATIVDTLFLNDHTLPSFKELFSFAAQTQQQGAEWLICTEKDWCKLEEHKEAYANLPILWLEMDMKVVAGEENWEVFKQLAI